MNDTEGLHPDLIVLADAARILGPSRYSILDELREIDAEADSQHPDALVTRLADDLYERLYIRPSTPENLAGVSWLEQRDFLAELSAANGGGGTWEPAVVRESPSEGRLVVRLHGINFQAPEAMVRPTARDFAAGAACRVRIPKELRNLGKGFYYAVGNQEDEAIGSLDVLDDEGEGAPQVRYYWHLTRKIASRFVASATSILNAAGVPFRLKVLRDPSAYHRADAGVIYLDPRHAASVSSLIGRIHREVEDGLRPSVPMLTLRLADGLALVVENRHAGSFGKGRCQWIARSLWKSFLAGEVDRAARLRRLRADWEAMGFDPSMPYKANRFDVDSIQLIMPGTAAHSAAVESRDEPSTVRAGSRQSGSTSPLDAALRIGRQLCDAAHWDRERLHCNWVGRSPRETRSDGTIEPMTAALGADLYGGSAGIALFLAHLHTETGDDASRRTALGAISRSIDQAARRPQFLGTAISLFEGRLGVAFAACSISRILGEASLREQAFAILPRIRPDLDEPHPLDLLGGSAGAIPALLALDQLDGRQPDSEGPDPLALAEALGEELCGRAERRDQVWTWAPDPDGRSESTSPPLCGMSHGASGIALGLLELHARTRRSEYLEGARGAFAYEDSQFHAGARNWPDLRAIESRREGASVRYGRAWCHGAPGIALARLRAAELDPGMAETHLEVARLALATTLAAIDDLLDHEDQDASLCHGLAGLLDIALIAGSQLEDPSMRGEVHRIAGVLIHRHDRRIDYPSGLPSRAPTPSLMLGLAGTGYALLRLHAPEAIPSILLPVKPSQLRDSGKVE